MLTDHGRPPVVGTEDTVQGYLAHEMFHLQRLELEGQARRERLVKVALRARFQNRKAGREAQELRRASDAVGRANGLVREERPALRTAR